MKKHNIFAKTAYNVFEQGVVEGYASVFCGLDAYGDTIEPTAYDNVLAEGQRPLMFYQHFSWNVPIGRWDELSVDEKGLKIKGTLNLELQQAKDIYSALKFGSITGMSIGFMWKDGDVEYDDEGIRHFKNISKLLEVSIVNFPADNAARISDVKSEDFEILETVRDCEYYLRDLGMSRKMAQTMISTIKQAKSSPVSDSPDVEESQKNAELDMLLQKVLNIANRR